MRRPLLALLPLAALACARPIAPPTPPPAAPTLPVAVNPPPAARDTDAINAPARAGAVTDTLHGVEVADPYRALETESPVTAAWVQAQNARSEAYLAAHPRPDITRRLGELLAIGNLRGASLGGSRVFYTKRDGDREQAVVMTSERSAAGAWSAPRQLFDPHTLGERSAVDWMAPSPRGRYLALGVSQNGDERSTLRVMEVATGRMLPEAIAHTKWCRLSWLPDESGFYFTRYPRAGEAHHDPAAEDTYWRALFFHRLGAAPDGAADARVFDVAERTHAPSPDVSDDGRWLVVNLFRGWSRSDVLLVDRRAPVARGALPRAAPVVVGRESISRGTVHRGRAFVLSNDRAPRFALHGAPAATLIAAPPSTAVRDEPALFAAAPWRAVVPQGEHPIEDFTLAGDRLVVSSLQNIASRLRSFTLDGADPRDIPLPAEGSAPSVVSNSGSPVVVFGFQSFFEPSAVMAVDARPSGLRPQVVDHATADVDFSRFVVERAAVPSRDGTPINAFILRPRAATADGTNPVLLYGYGGFNVSLLPTFRRDPLYWLERGGIYVVANLRGGGEFGEEWHQAGAMGNKQHVYEDFEAVLGWLSSSRWSSPSRIAINGGSNGGLLMGAMLTRAPERFAATFASVGLYDMVRFARFPPAEIWTSEYGDPARPDAFAWLHAYSPYHRVRDGERYPAAWIETADHDTRVHWGHSTKFAARLQDAQAGSAPLYFYMQRDVGHGAGTQRSDELRRLTRMFTFLEDRLGMTGASTGVTPAPQRGEEN
ncbi:MAG: prolyl oligopeptidase family serine peptidase [Deltaproteobacteria bacterium]|nr:prolyl oligopeptidase family serine peptidase [Myxococcales bacterium]MDP3221325.1 prolyl oligopeptidase family serine peptidase [Deltaproteobacteria bacterium]